MPNLTQQGDFLAAIEEYEIQENEITRSAGIKMKFLVFKQWDSNSQAFFDRENGEHVYGYQNIIKKDQTVNEISHRILMESSGWDGCIESIADKTWKPWVVRITVAENYVDGKRYYNVENLCHAESTGSRGLRAASSDTVKRLTATHASQLRASASAIQQGMQEQEKKAEFDEQILNKDKPEPLPQAGPPDEVPF